MTSKRLVVIRSSSLAPCYRCASFSSWDTIENCVSEHEVISASITVVSSSAFTVSRFQLRYIRAWGYRHEVIVQCGLLGVEHDERNDSLVQTMI